MGFISRHIDMKLSLDNSTNNRGVGNCMKLYIDIADAVYPLIRILPGKFFMGGNKAFDGELREVIIPNPYYIGVFPITQFLWRQFYPNNNSSKYIGPNRPVDELSLDDCLSFIETIKHRTGLPFSIPTESQWEYAAQGGPFSNHSLLAGGNNPDELFGKNEIEDGYQSVTYDVGIFKANELGLFDMNSNVAEWCTSYDDKYHKYVLKGGVMGYEGGLIWEECSIAEQIHETADSYTPNKGLRLVVNL